MRYDISKRKAPEMPNLGKGTECIKLLLSQASKDMHEPLVPMFFPVLGAHISGAEFQYPDLTWKEMCGQMAHLVADSGNNKGQLGNLVEAICRDFRQHDEEEMKKLVEWARLTKTRGANKECTPEPTPLCTFGATRYERFFERPWLSPEARRFLFEERRLDPRVVRWCRLTSWKDREGVPWLQIPYYDREGKLVGVQNRNLIKGGSPRFRFPQGSQCSIYNLPVLNMLKPGDELYIAEGASDCWSLLSAGHKAIAIPSATLLTKKDIELLKQLGHFGKSSSEHFGDSPSVIRYASHSGDSPRVLS